MGRLPTRFARLAGHEAPQTRRTTGPLGRRAGPRVLGGVLLVVVSVLVLARPAAAGDPASRGGDEVFVVNVSGLIDPVVVSFIEKSLEQAEENDAVALVIALNSQGAVVSDEDFTELARSLRDSDVPLAIWVGTSGAKAFGAAAELVGIAEVSGMAPGTSLGEIGEQRLPVDEFGVLFGEYADELADGRVDEHEALEQGLISTFPTEDETSVEGAPTLGDFLVNIPGVESRIIEVGGERRREPVTTVVLGSLTLLDQLAHTVASPEVAYLLLALGLGLLVFELFTAGIGVAGVVGAVSLVLACYGLWVLPTNWWAVVLMGIAFFGFAIDVQTGVPRAWTAIGMVLYVIASFSLYDGLTMSWVTIAAGIIGVALAFLAGMPSMVRTRFSTPTIGRDWMVGEMGEAVVDVAPTGIVRIREALWRAETNRATPITAGDQVRVVAIEGLLLEVEPEEGGARDYRERAKAPAPVDAADAPD